MIHNQIDIIVLTESSEVSSEFNKSSMREPHQNRFPAPASPFTKIRTPVSFLLMTDVILSNISFWPSLVHLLTCEMERI